MKVDRISKEALGCQKLLVVKQINQKKPKPNKNLKAHLEYCIWYDSAI